MIVEYKLHKLRARSDNKITPIWIDEGGHWYNSADNTYVGCISDSVEYYIPSTLTKFTKVLLEQESQLCMLLQPFKKMILIM